MTRDALMGVMESGFDVYDLARPYEVGMPQSPNHPPYWRAMPRRHGDMRRADGSSAANDLITMGTHVGTHVDALGHVSHLGELYGGMSADAAQSGGSLASHGIEQFEPFVGRAVLLDIPVILSVDRCDAGYEVTVSDLEAAAELVEGAIRPGDVVLIRSGWGQLWDEGLAYVGRESGVPGVGEAGARWLASKGPRAVGADTIAFECLRPGAGHGLLPAHRVLLVEHGVNIIETMALETIAEAGIRSFLFVAAPLPLVGATGAPVRPLAVLAAEGADG